MEAMNRAYNFHRTHSSDVFGTINPDCPDCRPLVDRYRASVAIVLAEHQPLEMPYGLTCLGPKCDWTDLDNLTFNAHLLAEVDKLWKL